MSDPLLHIGYHRAGSTWLQRFLFANTEAGFVQPFDRKKDVSPALVAPHPLEFDPAAAARVFSDGLARAAAEGKVPVISAERLSGYPDSGGYDSKEIADRLATVFPDSRILIVIRRQEEMLLSFYKVYVWAGGALPLEEYVDPPKRGRMRQPRFRFAYLAYHRLIAYYQKRFGRDRVMVLPFEDIRSTPERVAADIAAHAGLSRQPDVADARQVNQSLNAGLVMAKRRLNPFTARDSTNAYSPLAVPALARPSGSLLTRLDRVLPATLARRWEADLKSRIDRLTEGRYAESNRRVADLTGLDLAQRGYDV